MSKASALSKSTLQLLQELTKQMLVEAKKENWKKLDELDGHRRYLLDAGGTTDPGKIALVSLHQLDSHSQGLADGIVSQDSPLSVHNTARAMSAKAPAQTMNSERESKNRDELCLALLDLDRLLVQTVLFIKKEKQAELYYNNKRMRAAKGYATAT